MQNEVNKSGLDLLKSFEKLRLRAYDDFKPNVKLSSDTKIIGTLTIGWGHTGKDVKWDSIIDEKKADELLIQDLINAEKIVKNLVKIPINDNQYSALVSFAYNCGGGYISKSTGKWTSYELWRFVNEKKEIKQKWLSTAITSNGKKLHGLVNRRLAEVNLFLK